MKEEDQQVVMRAVGDLSENLFTQIDEVIKICVNACDAKNLHPFVIGDVLDNALMKAYVKAILWATNAAKSLPDGPLTDDEERVAICCWNLRRNLKSNMANIQLPGVCMNQEMIDKIMELDRRYEAAIASMEL